MAAGLCNVQDFGNWLQRPPIGYGIKAFDLGGHGRIVPAKISAQSKLNLTAYGVLAEDKSLFITLINKDHDAGGRDAAVTLALGKGYTHGQVISLPHPTVTSRPSRGDAGWLKSRTTGLGKKSGSH